MITEYESAMNARLSDRDKELMISVLQWADSHPANQWHKVEDGLPPRRSEYSHLSIDVWATNGVDVYKTYYDYYVECWNKYYVTHWMPLPELPKEG